MIDLTTSIGLEQIAHGAFEILLEELNAEIAVVEAESVVMDQSADEARGRQYRPITVEPVERNNFHLGHQPSLVLAELPLRTYPSVSVMSYRSQPAPGNASWDHGTSLRDSLYAEVLVKAGPIRANEPWRAAEECNKRLWRTLDAVNTVLMRNQTLGGIVTGLEDPQAVASEAFTRPQSDENPEIDWFWQAGRLDYLVAKFSPFE